MLLLGAHRRRVVGLWTVCDMDNEVLIDMLVSTISETTAAKQQTRTRPCEGGAARVHASGYLSSAICRPFGASIDTVNTTHHTAKGDVVFDVAYCCVLIAAAKLTRSKAMMT